LVQFGWLDVGLRKKERKKEKKTNVKRPNKDWYADSAAD
jgi:hypothetical protein